MLILITIFILAILFILIATIRAPIDNLFVFGPLYVIRRYNGKPGDRHFSIGFMHQTSSPWRKGKGLQVRISKNVVQIGFSKKQPHHDEEQGSLSVIGGRYLETPAKEIGDW